MAPEKEHDMLDELSRLLLDTIMLAKPPQVPARFASVDSLQALYTNLISLRDFLYAASNGDLSNHVPFKGYIAGTLKTLQANLKHITWQTKMIASGDFTQRIEFMGQFSESFNAMVIQLDQTLKELVRKETELSQANQELLKEISIRKQAEAALRESEARNRILVKNTSDVVFNLDDTGHITFVNPAAFRISGYKEEEIIGKHYATLIRPDMRDEGIKFLGRQFIKERKKNVYYEYPIITKEGHEVWLGQNIQMIEEDGRITGFHSVGRDITDRKRAEGALEEALRESESLSKSLIDYMHDAVLILDWDGSILFANREAAKIIEFERPEELIGHNMVEYLHPDYFQKAAEDLEAVKADKMGFLSEYQLHSVTGRHIWVESIGGKIIFRNASVNLVCIRDITERKRAEEVLRESEERFRRIFNEGPFGMGLEGPDHTILAANKVLCGLLGYTEQELAGQNIADITYEEDREKSKELLGQLFANSIPVFRLEKRYVRKDGTILWANTSISAIHGKEGNVLYGLAIIEDITENKKAAEKIHRLAYYDNLTGLPNRTFHKELIKRSIEHARRHQEIFALIYIGLDNFQRINDTLGYSIGDLLLQAVADRLANSMRKSDYVARSAEGETVKVISRVGGDEFIVLAHDLNQAQDAAKTSRRLLEELSAPYDLNGREVFVTVSIGIALYPDDGADVDDLLKNAEKAMRYTKSEGKNNYHFYSSSMHSSVLELLTLENDLHRALERKELVLYYQPKVDAATRRVIGMEALIRWKHPDRGLIPPIQFIPMAETSGLILPIGEFVIRTVCKQIKTWQEAGYKQINIALNVSSHQFEKQNLIEIMKTALQDTMISPQCLEVEITESTIMRNPEKAIQILMEIKAMGLRIAIDDFGTGYSSLSYLKRLPLDFLKIDQSFVKGVATDPKDQTIVRTTIAMAHSLNLKTIAEGVETEEQLHFLQEHGCDEIQGYLFSQPLPAGEIPGILVKGYL